MQSKPNDWHGPFLSLDVQNQNSEPCCFGRHALKFARRRESAAGENIAPADIGYAQKECVCGEFVGANGLLRRPRVTERRSADGSSGENITTIAASGSGQSGK